MAFKKDAAKGKKDRKVGTGSQPTGQAKAEAILNYKRVGVSGAGDASFELDTEHSDVFEHGDRGNIFAAILMPSGGEARLTARRNAYLPGAQPDVQALRFIVKAESIQSAPVAPVGDFETLKARKDLAGLVAFYKAIPGLSMSDKAALAAATKAIA